MLPLLWEGTLRVGRDERPRSSAERMALLMGYGNRGWLKPPPPQEGFVRVSSYHLS